MGLRQLHAGKLTPCSQSVLQDSFLPTLHYQNFPKDYALDSDSLHTGIPIHGALHCASTSALLVSTRSTNASSQVCMCTSDILTKQQLYADITCIDWSLQCRHGLIPHRPLGHCQWDSCLFKMSFTARGLEVLLHSVEPHCKGLCTGWEPEQLCRYGSSMKMASY